MWFCQSIVDHNYPWSSFCIEEKISWHFWTRQNTLCSILQVLTTFWDNFPGVFLILGLMIHKNWQIDRHHNTSVNHFPSIQSRLGQIVKWDFCCSINELSMILIQCPILWHLPHIAFNNNWLVHAKSNVQFLASIIHCNVNGMNNMN